MSDKTAFQEGRAARTYRVVSDTTPTTENYPPGTVWVEQDAGKVHINVGTFDTPVWVEMAQV